MEKSKKGIKTLLIMAIISPVISVLVNMFFQNQVDRTTKIETAASIEYVNETAKNLRSEVEKHVSDIDKSVGYIKDNMVTKTEFNEFKTLTNEEFKKSELERRQLLEEILDILKQ